ncbi:hypothetical protein GX51_05092 [Blastomyces parvus]|uniref:Uncharacterized protein n=1 Tax=Blastomyces parvus TaxID=2060905 RepID=A0A2B7WYH5_9EURO|nr:hypothetical protein GX51_05092 [Blastomyces parvus]
MAQASAVAIYPKAGRHGDKDKDVAMENGSPLTDSVSTATIESLRFSQPALMDPSLATHLRFFSVTRPATRKANNKTATARNYKLRLCICVLTAVPWPSVPPLADTTRKKHPTRKALKEIINRERKSEQPISGS